MWDPEQYARFAGERGRPFVELLSRVDLQSPRRVVDLGCGAGNLTALLVDRWPTATVVGIDSSPEMISAASSHGTGFLWDLCCPLLHLRFCLLAVRAVEHQEICKPPRCRSVLTSFMGSRQSGQSGGTRRTACGRTSVSQRGHLDLGQNVAPGRGDVRSSASPKAARFSSIRLGSGSRLALRRHPVAPRREVRAQDELALETARLETAVCLGHPHRGIRSATRGRMA